MADAQSSIAQEGIICEGRAGHKDSLQAEEGKETFERSALSCALKVSSLSNEPCTPLMLLLVQSERGQEEGDNEGQQQG